MTQADLINAVHAELGPDTKVAKSTIDAVFKAAANVGLHALSEGNEFYLFGLGKIGVTQRAARKGRNPRTGATINLPAKRAAKYTANKAVKDAVNGGAA